MKDHCKYFFIFLFMFIFLHGSPTTALEEVEDEREFDYEEGGEKGPGRWGELKKEWAACKNGGMQSPIDMSNQRVKIITNSSVLKMDYRPCNATVKNRGHDISLRWVGDSGSVKINGTDYFLEQAHWHSPSEHSINGKRYDLELHMVHVTRDLNVKNKIAVIGLFYEIGKTDKFLSKLTSNLSSMHEERNVGVIDPRDIKMGGKHYYKYIGSLTVPPCTEGVIWTINQKVRSVSQEQVQLLREVVHDYAEENARPLQPLNAREVQLYDPDINEGNTND